MCGLLLATRNRKSFLKLGCTTRTWGHPPTKEEATHKGGPTKEGGQRRTDHPQRRRPQVCQGHSVTKDPLDLLHLSSLGTSTAARGSLVPTWAPTPGAVPGVPAGTAAPRHRHGASCSHISSFRVQEPSRNPCGSHAHFCIRPWEKGCLGRLACPRGQGPRHVEGGGGCRTDPGPWGWP